MRQYAVDYYTAPLVSSSMELNTHAKKVAMRATRHARRERVPPLAPYYSGVSLRFQVAG